MLSPEDSTILDNPKYRQYMNAVDKALRSFESSSEWADLIAALGKLNKVLNSKFKVIPKKITIGKRLAQCMHPALPGGVHIKALDVYDSIFKIIETERLKTDLYIYAMGIFPLFVNASMQVRPVLLNLYETHFLPLDGALRSCVDGLLLGLLPGLEEGTDHFERTDILLQRICEKVGKLEFFSAVWRCILSSSSVRLFAVQLILRRFNRKKSTDDQLYIIGSDIDVMVRSLKESLQDNSVLTQRASLDVLILCCPLSHIPISRKDCCELLLAALQCLLRRDMSLNRRLYSWLLGYDLAKRQLSTGSTDQNESETYFELHSKDLLTEAILYILTAQREKIISCEAKNQISVLEELYPFRLLISLLDKPEIGPVIIEALLIDVFRLLQAAVDFVKKKYEGSQRLSNGEGGDMKATKLTEISKQANLLLGVFEPGYIWQFLSQQLHYSVQWEDQQKETNSEANLSTPYAEVCCFIHLLLRIVNLESYQEIQTLHLPNLLYEVIRSLNSSVEQFSAEDLKLALQTCSMLLDLTQPVQHDEVSLLSAASDAKAELTVKISSTDSSKDMLEHHDVLQCSDLFNLFFCKLVESKFSCDFTSINRCIANLEVGGLERNTETCKEHEGVTKQSQPYDSDPSLSDSDRKCDKNLKELNLIDIFKQTCQLLLDFACFPVYCNGKSYDSPEKNNAASVRFPQWLKCLLWCICDGSFPLSSFFEISSASVSTVLDLVSLAYSVATKRRPKKDEESCVGTVSVVVLSPLTLSHVRMLTEKTLFYQHVTDKLWKVLGNETLYEHHLTSVQLLIRLHSMCSDDRCEDVLIEYIMHSDKEIRTKALSQFCHFWHLTRTLLSKKISLQSGGNYRNFNRCLFAVIDALSLSNQQSHFLSSAFHLYDGGGSVLMSIASSWLHQCLEERDLVRILEPLLMVALHPRTHSTQIKPLRGVDVPAFAKNLPCEQERAEANSSVDSSCIKNDSPEKVHTMRSDVMLEIAKGKELYKELISSLTSLNHEESKEQQIELKADQIVKEILAAATEILACENLQSGKKEDDVESLHSDIAFGETFVLQPTASDETIDNFSTFHSVKNFSKLNTNKHMLVYQENFHASRALYTLRSISTLLHTHPRLFTYAAVTSQLSSYTSQLAGGGLLQDLLARHQQVLSGHSFYDDVTSRHQNMMIIDVLTVVCLHFIRSWHPEEVIPPEALQDIRCCASSLLCSLLVQMTDFARENVAATSSSLSSSIGVTSQHIGPFVRSVLDKYNVSEIVLSSLATTVQALHMAKEDNLEFPMSPKPRRVHVARASITSLDEVNLAYWWCGNDVVRVRSFQDHLLALVRALVILEHHLEDNEAFSTKDYSTEAKQSHVTSSAYQPNCPVATQPLLASSLLRVLRLQGACEAHPAWLDLLTSSLTYLSRALPELTAPVTSQLCRNLEHASSLYLAWNDKHNVTASARMPADYLVTLLKSLRTLTHFSLLLQSGSSLQNSTASAASQFNKVERLAPSSTTTGSNVGANNIGFSTLGGFFSVFSNSNSLKSQRSIEEQVLSANWIETRRATLRNLPRILSCLSIVWDKVVSVSSSIITPKKGRKSPGVVNPCVAMGDSEAVSQSVLQILNPLSVQYGENLMSALAIVWERRGRGNAKHQQAQPLPQLSQQQLQLLNVVSSIRALHCDITLNLVKRVIVQPPELPSLASGKKKKIPFEECLLDFSFHFLQRQTVSALRESWSSLLSLLRECNVIGHVGTPSSSTSSSLSSGSNPGLGGKRALTARSYFLLLLLVAEYVKRVPSFEDKKDQKDLQEICVKCIEACNTIVDRSLEHGGWLARRAPSVLPGPQPATVNSHRKQHAPECGSSLELLDHHSKDRDQPLKTVTSDPVLPSNKDRPDNLPLPTAVIPQTFNHHYNSSVQALNVLAQVLANLLDVIYGSEEKDKSVPVLTPVMNNVTPFLRTHSSKNIPSYKAAACLLSSVSGYQQTRRAWKRDAFELFLAPDFFSMPVESVSEWRNIIDHLMTHDSTTFKDLMVRIGLTRNAATGTSLNIFSNKEQELEQRAMLLKRLAFVIFSSGLNQYQRHLPEIQERLSESLRLHQVPVVQEQVFLCFRVLLLRVSPNHLTSLWPSIITELVQVMGQMEQELLHNDLDGSVVESGSDVLPKLNKSNASTPTSGVGVLFNSISSTSSGAVQEKWLAMYLSACKLLDLTLLLQPSQLTYFKMFRWSFVGEPGEVIHDVHQENDVNKAPPRPARESHASVKTHPPKPTQKPRPKKLFLPHCVRIKRLLNEKLPSGKSTLLEVSPVRPLLDMRRMTSIFELQPFFNTMVSSSTMLNMHQCKTISPLASEEQVLSSSTIENLMEKDFVVLI